MSDALEDDGKVSIGDRNFSSPRFADDIDALSEKEQELEAPFESLSKVQGIRWRSVLKRPKLVTNNAKGIQREIKVKGQKLGTAASFRSLGTVVQMMATNQRYSQGLHKPLQLLQN